MPTGILSELQCRVPRTARHGGSSTCQSVFQGALAEHSPQGTVAPHVVAWTEHWNDQLDGFLFLCGSHGLGWRGAGRRRRTALAEPQCEMSTSAAITTTIAQNRLSVLSLRIMAAMYASVV